MTEPHKISILFVDDEPRILQGLRRMLHGMRSEWKMSYAVGGREALDMMRESTFDVIVTDMRMPDMDGAALLNEVVSIYPDTIRIVLSGQADKDLILQTVKPAHQYLSKPCEPDKLKSTIYRTCVLRDLLNGKKIKRLISRMHNLPSVPALYTRIMEEVRSSDPSLKKVGRIIEQDIGMSAKILQLVNSAFFGLPREILHPSQAVTLLGIDLIKSLVLSIQVFSAFNGKVPGHFRINELWEHSSAVGRSARTIAKSMKLDNQEADHAFISGLLHDVGKLVLASNLPDEYSTVLQKAETDNKTLSDVEFQIFETTHAQIGAYLMGLWGLPGNVVETIAHHHRPSESPVKGFNALSAVHIANTLYHDIQRPVDHPARSGIDKDVISLIDIENRLSECEAIVTEEMERGVKI